MSRQNVITNNNTGYFYKSLVNQYFLQQPSLMNGKSILEQLEWYSSWNDNPAINISPPPHKKLVRWIGFIHFFHFVIMTSQSFGQLQRAYSNGKGRFW